MAVAELGGVELTRIGLGTNRLTDTPQNREFIRAAVDAGVQLIDTAHIYTGGESEATIGAALSPVPDGVVVATKGAYTASGAPPDRLRAQIEDSLQRLRTETIGLYYLHRLHDSVPVEDQLAVLAEYRDAGRIAHVGLSEVGVEQIERARQVMPIAAVQNEYNLEERMWETVVDFCASEGILFVPFYPLHGSKRARKIARRYEATPHQIALAFLLRRSPTMLPIPGTLSLDHLRDNLAALELELSDEDYAELFAA